MLGDGAAVDAEGRGHLCGGDGGVVGDHLQQDFAGFLSTFSVYLGSFLSTCLTRVLRHLALQVGDVLIVHKDNKRAHWKVRPFVIFCRRYTCVPVISGRVSASSCTRAVSRRRCGRRS